MPRKLLLSQKKIIEYYVTEKFNNHLVFIDLEERYEIIAKRNVYETISCDIDRYADDFHNRLLFPKNDDKSIEQFRKEWK